MSGVRVPIFVRILGLNLLLVFVPVASFLSLGDYEKSLLEALESSLVQQGRLLAAWLSEGDLDAVRATAALESLGRRHTARLRIVAAGGDLLADSSSLPSAENPTDDSPPRGEEGGDAAKEPAADNPVYRAFSALARFYRRFSAPSEALPSADFYGKGRSFLDGPEVRAALEGRYGAATRISAGGQVSVTLYSALPVLAKDGTVAGAVLVSQSTYRILTKLYQLRLEVARVFLLSVAASVALSVVLYLSISRPLNRLRDRARTALALPVLPDGHFSRGGVVSDEIEDLAGTLREFSSRLGERLSWAEGFAADLAHELRNPLASIRASAELVDGANAAEARVLSARIAADCDRINRIVGGLRELSRIEAEPHESGGSDLAACLRNAAERARDSAEARAKGVSVAVLGPEGGTGEGGAPLRAALPPDRLCIALGALLDNAVSFSPPGGEVSVSAVQAGAGEVAVSVFDRGPGLPPGDASRVFERFFSTRRGAAADAAEGGQHYGLGLAIVRSIAARAGGSAEAADREGGGARFTLRLPAAR